MGQLDHVALLGDAAVGGERAAQALDPRRGREGADGGRLGGELVGLDAADVGRRELARQLAEVLHRGGDGEREQPAGGEVRRAALRNAARSGSSCTVCIGTAMSAKRRPSAKTCASAVTLEPERGRLGTGAERGEHARLAVERRDGESVPREVERDPPCARADVEHRAAVLLGELAPERQVGLVAAALHVVPDDEGENGVSATPRSATDRGGQRAVIASGPSRRRARPRSRSSSSAV